MPTQDKHELDLLLGNSNKRFSGVTSTMLQVLEEQKKILNVAVLGDHFVPEGTPTLSFWQAIRLRKNRKNPLIFHARRNNEMLQALILKTCFRVPMKIVFTSTAQRYHSWLTRWLMSKMDGLVSTCAAAAHYMAHKPDIIIPHGIDQTIYTPAVNKSALWHELGLKGKYGIGIFGRVRKQKGVDLLVDAAIPLLKKHEDYNIIIVGEITPDNQTFVDEQKQKIADANLENRFTFTGKQPFEKIPQLFRAMSIITALSRNEGFGLTVLEAMSSGVPVLASSAGAWPEIISDGIDGCLTPCDDTSTIREKLNFLMSLSSTTLENMGVQGRKKIEAKFTTQREAQALCEYFQHL